MASFRGYPCSPELAEWLTWYERVLLFKGVIRFNLDVFQLKGTYYKSAGVHEDGYAFDIAQMDDVSLEVADEMGAFSWPRTRAQGFTPHQHGGLYGIPGMNAGLAGQGRDRKNGWNGLVGKHRARDPRPVSGRDWKQGIAWAKALLAKEAVVTPKPADVIDLANYKLTKDNGKEVKQPALDDYSDAGFHVTESGDGVAFRAKCGGGTTPNSTHTRYELREMANRGLNLASWDNRRGTHEQKATYRVTHLPKNKPEAVCMQIHDPDDDVVMVRLVGDPKNPLGPIKVYAEWSKGKGKGSVKELLGTVRLGKKFYVRIVADEDGIRVRLQVSGSSVVTERKRAWVRTRLYFKAGVYNQSDTEHDRADDYAELVIYKDSLKVRHAA